MNTTVSQPTTHTVATFSIEHLCYIDANSQATQPLPAFADPDTLVQLYRTLSLVRAMDTKAVNLQRTGQMSTYPSSRGQEAVSVAIGHAMESDDILCPYYRDQGALLQRGVAMEEIYLYWGGDERGNQFAHNAHDFPMCVPIAGQFLHATGVAFAVQYRQQHRVVVTTGGDGSTSKGDFYEAINVAGVWNLPMVFVINNNQWAISVPRSAQTASESIAQKAIAAGIACLQVDGNDVIAVRCAMQTALARARAGQGPTLIEAITYRLCDHTTADDATRYQPPEEVNAAQKRECIARLAYYMQAQGFWSKQHEAELQQSINATVNEAVEKYLQTPDAPASSLFDYLYDSVPAALLDQYDELSGEPS